MEQESRGADRRGGPEVNDCCEKVYIQQILSYS